MHTVQLLLKPSKYERYEIDRRFRALAHLHNVCVKHARKCMVRLQYDKDYAALRQQYMELSKKLSKKEELSKEDKAEKKALSAQLAERRTVYGVVSRSACLETERHFALSVSWILIRLGENPIRMVPVLIQRP